MYVMSCLLYLCDCPNHSFRVLSCFQVKLQITEENFHIDIEQWQGVCKIFWQIYFLLCVKDDCLRLHFLLRLSIWSQRPWTKASGRLIWGGQYRSFLSELFTWPDMNKDLFQDCTGTHGFGWGGILRGGRLRLRSGFGSSSCSGFGTCRWFFALQ